MTGAALVVRGDARTIPLPDESVDLVVTSPPYWALRIYTDGGSRCPGQVGGENHPRAFLAALWAATREMIRVVKPSGSIWVNLGDKYAESGGGASGVPAKSLIGIPWRYAIGCIDDLGLILRAEVIWNKTNGLPESVTDRPRSSHEQWFMFTRRPRYFSAVDEIREAHTEPDGRPGYGRQRQRHAGGNRGINVGARPHASYRDMGQHPLGKVPGSVWPVASGTFRAPAHLGVDHFATFPSALPRRIILGWSPSGICVECGEGRRPVIARSGRERAAVTTGYVCACPVPSAGTRPAVVLDPFGGTGTTALVASVLGRVGVSLDLSHDYGRLARWRTADPGQRAKVARTAGVGSGLVGQLDLIGALTDTGYGDVG